MSKKPKTPMRKLREARGITQKELSEILGVDPTSITKIETNVHSSPELAERIAKYFGTAITEEQILYPERFPDYAVLPEHVA